MLFFGEESEKLLLFNRMCRLDPFLDDSAVRRVESISGEDIDIHIHGCTGWQITLNKSVRSYTHSTRRIFGRFVE